MNIDESVFAVKLYEMEEQYGKLQCRIRICEQGGRERIRSELEKAEVEYRENSMLLEEKAKACRSPAVTKLTQAQLDYRQKIGDVMKKQVIKDLHSVTVLRSRMKEKQTCCMRNSPWILPRLPCSRH